MVEEILDTKNSLRKTDAFVLPLSLEDNATITGTSAILKDFESEFNLHSPFKKSEFLPYDNLNGSFDVNLARSRFEYIISQSKHLSNMANFEDDLVNRELHLDGMTLNDVSNKQVSDVNEGDDVDRTTSSEYHLNTNMSCTLESERRRFRNEDEIFWQSYNHLASRIQTVVTSNSDEMY